jgi:uncharacterized membrane protein YkvA (DUF1232 family)
VTGSRQNTGKQKQLQPAAKSTSCYRNLYGEPNIVIKARRRRACRNGLSMIRDWLHARTVLWARDLIFVVHQIHYLSRVIRHPMTPWPARVAAGCAVAYIFSPIQLIPTFIPLIGQLDDLLVVYVGVSVVRGLTPHSVLADCEGAGSNPQSFRSKQNGFRFSVRQNSVCRRHQNIPLT